MLSGLPSSSRHPDGPPTEESMRVNSAHSLLRPRPTPSPKIGPGPTPQRPQIHPRSAADRSLIGHRSAPASPEIRPRCARDRPQLERRSSQTDPRSTPDPLLISPSHRPQVDPRPTTDLVRPRSSTHRPPRIKARSTESRQNFGPDSAMDSPWSAATSTSAPCIKSQVCPGSTPDRCRTDPASAPDPGSTADPP